MGFMKNMMKAGLDELNKKDSSSSGGAAATSGSHPTRWERSVMCAPGIIQSVLRFDRDGVDVLSFPGEHGGFNDVYRNIKNINGFEERVNATAPHGDCMLGKAVEKMIDEAFERGFDKRPTAMLVLTAGRPNDHNELTKLLSSTAKKMQNPNDLSITFVQIGNDVWAENYLKSLLTNQDINTNDAGESIDFIDVVLDDEIQKSLDQMKRESMNGVAGGILGAVAGAGLGIGGAYLANKMQAKKRTKGWNGQWRFIVEGDELSVLEVKDDEEGNLIITGWPEGMNYSGTYATSEDGGMSLKLISATKMVSDEVIGVVEDEHTINWDDGSKWEEINPAGPDWKAMAAAAAGGAAVGGATGALLDKKFFNKANRQVPSEYVVIMDRSAEMLVKDTGNPTNAGPPRGVGGSGGGGATTLPGAVGGGGATTLPGGGGGGGKFGFTDKQAKFEDVPWGSMTPEAHKAAKTLGWDKDSWNAQEWGDIDDYKWQDLEEEQLEAARELGWDKISWDEKYEHQSWDQLPDHVKTAARKLGFNQEQWDDEEDGKGWESWEKEWGDFTPEEKRCMHVLGWYKHTWG